MSLPSLDRSHATQASQPQVPSASAPTTPVPQGVCSVSETVSAEVSTCPSSFFQPVVDFFASIFQAIGDFLKRTDDFLVRIFHFLKRETGTGVTTLVRDSGHGPYVHLSRDFEIEECLDLTVNKAKIIGEVPELLNLAAIQEITRNANPPIEINDLLTQFDRICDLKGINGDSDVLYLNLAGEATRKDAARRFLEVYYLNLVNANLQSGDPFLENAASEIATVLKGIIFELRAPTDGSEEDLEVIAKKAGAIENLCKVAEQFSYERSIKLLLRQHTKTFNVYRSLSKRMGALGEIVKHYIQEAKETMLWAYYDSSETLPPYCMLNYIRKTVGTELGLNVHPTNLADPQISDGRFYTLPPENRFALPHEGSDQFHAVFNRVCIPPNILFIMKLLFNERIISDPGFAREVREWIENQIQAHPDAGGLVAADTQAPLPMPYQDPHAPYQLTKEGIKFLMVHFGYLNSQNASRSSC